MKFILDASVFISGFKTPGEQSVTVPGVLEELRDARSRIQFELAERSGMKVEESDEKLIHEVMERSKDIGDFEYLSQTDIHILAKALEYLEQGTAIVTDDYAIQNVAAHLNISVMPIMQDGIKEVLRWTKRCSGCGRYFEAGEVCPVCGSKLKKSRKIKKE